VKSFEKSFWVLGPDPSCFKRLQNSFLIEVGNMRSISQSAVQDAESAEAKELIYSLHGMQVKADLTTFENEGLRYALEVRKI
jgi:hypothetical protein